eukprot:1127343-Ditylum_brightwellii.AAC.1
MFAISKVHKEEVRKFIDSLLEKIRSTFKFELVNLVDPNNDIKRKRKFTLLKYTRRASAAYKSVMSQGSTSSLNSSPPAWKRHHGQCIPTDGNSNNSNKDKLQQCNLEREHREQEEDDNEME